MRVFPPDPNIPTPPFFVTSPNGRFTPFPYPARPEPPVSFFFFGYGAPALTESRKDLCCSPGIFLSFTSAVIPFIAVFSLRRRLVLVPALSPCTNPYDPGAICFLFQD